MAHRLDLLLRPRSIAIVGGGAWCASVLAQCAKIGFQGPVWPVHPTKAKIGGRKTYPDIAALPRAPDATFIGVNRYATIEVVRALAARGAGGAVCFASGFKEAAAEDEGSADLQDALREAADEMPILGPNCYGFINYLDGVLLWPDQHGGKPVQTGVAIITQSSNIALNLTMQTRGLPLAYVVTAGNQAQTGMADLGQALLEDPRVSCLGLHIEGLGDLRAVEALAAKARKLGKPIVALKLGRSHQARAATMSHTASLAGNEAGTDALLRRLGMIRAADLTGFLETLKLLHVHGRLPSNKIASISCSGGEASLAADTGLAHKVQFPPLTQAQSEGLRHALGPMVALANPLDYHTYIWRDTEAMTRTFAAMADPGIALTVIIADFPRPDRCDPGDWDCVIQAVSAAATRTGARYGIVATLPELMPEPVAEQLIATGIVPFSGLTEAMAACAAASTASPPEAPPLLLPTPTVDAVIVPEGQAKASLEVHGLRIPRAQGGLELAEAGEAADQIGYPVALKGEGIAHKTEARAVALNLTSAMDVARAGAAMPTDRFLVEEMVMDGVAELLIGVVKDPASGFVMTLGAGGVLTELLADTASVLLPATDEMVLDALLSLSCARLLHGYRGAPAADIPAVLRAIRAVEAYVMTQADGLDEIEINPLICTEHDAIAADALIRRKDA
jgi:acyl-CoA synthetase (NDP forming)